VKRREGSGESASDAPSLFLGEVAIYLAPVEHPNEGHDFLFNDETYSVITNSDPVIRTFRF